MRTDSALNCSFCGRAQKEVNRLIAGPSAHICNICVEICNEIIANDASSNTLEPMRASAQERENILGADIPCSLCQSLTPADQCLLIPERGQLCPACLEAVRLVV